MPSIIAIFSHFWADFWKFFWKNWKFLEIFEKTENFSKTDETLSVCSFFDARRPDGVGFSKIGKKRDIRLFPGWNFKGPLRPNQCAEWAQIRRVRPSRAKLWPRKVWRNLSFGSVFELSQDPRNFESIVRRKKRTLPFDRERKNKHLRSFFGGCARPGPSGRDVHHFGPSARPGLGRR